MRRRLQVRRGDTVQVTCGSARGLRGRVLRAVPEKGRIVIEGVNLVWKHMRPSREHPAGGRIQVEAALDASNVMLICPNRECARYDKPVRAKSAVRGDGRKVRACAKCGAEIPTPE